MTRNLFFAFLLIGLGLFYWAAQYLNLSDPDVDLAPKVIFFSAFVAFVTFLINASLSHRSQIAANALNTLQALRTDEDYLKRAELVRNKIGGFGTKVPRDIYLLLVAPRGLQGHVCDTCGRGTSTSADRDFATAVDFMLNHYEFIAAGARRGAIDKRMLRETIRSTVLGFAITFEDYIHYERSTNPNIWRNLVWLCSEFDRKTWPNDGSRLGPPA